jgi:hypothetical protein
MTNTRSESTVNKAEKVWRNVYTFSAHTPGYPFEVHFGILLPNLQDPILTACDFPLVEDTLKMTISDLVSLFNPFPELKGNVGFIAYQMIPGGRVDLFIKNLEEFSFYGIKQDPIVKQQVQQLRIIQQQVINSISYRVVREATFVDRSWAKQLYSGLTTLFLSKSTLTNEDKVDHLLPIMPRNISSDTHFLLGVKNLPSLDAEEQQNYVNKSPIEELPLEPVAVIKTEKLHKPPSSSMGVHPRSGITNLDFPFREVLSYELQQIIGVDFGIPTTLLTRIKHPYFDESKHLAASIQRFVKGKTLEHFRKNSSFEDFSDYRFPTKEFEKFLIDIVIFSMDSHYNNLIVSRDSHLKTFKITAKIDNSLSLPNPDTSLDCLREARLSWLIRDEANEKMSMEMGSLFLNMNIDLVIEHLKSRMKESQRAAHVENNITDSTWNLLKFNFILMKVGAELDLPIKAIGITLMPLWNSEQKLVGGEVVDIFTQHISKKNSVDWNAVKNAITKTISLPYNERKVSPSYRYLAGFFTSKDNILENC